MGSKFAGREVAEGPAVEVDRVGRSFQTAVPGRSFLTHGQSGTFPRQGGE